MNMIRVIETINNSINTEKITINVDDCIFAVLYLCGFEYREYPSLITEINRMRFKANTYEEKASFLELYEQVYKAQRRKYKALLKQIDAKAVSIEFTSKNITPDGVKAAALKVCEKDIQENGIDVYYELLRSAVERRIEETNDELRVLKKYSHEYINTSTVYIGPYSILRHRDGRVFYKDCAIIPSVEDSFSLLYSERSTESTKNGIIDILAYLNGSPYFLFTENPNFNRKLSELYNNFDLLDMVRLRKKNYFKDKDDEKPVALQMPILNAVDKRYIVAIPPSSHETVFALYHASLKQFEPLPRCVFLYRVFEYGANHHYQRLINPTTYDPKDAIEYYYTKIFDHNYTPLYYLAYGKVKFDSENSEVKVIRRSECRNYISVLKREAHSIADEWSRHDYLKDKRLGEIIYNTGRCAAAHGSGGRGMARYDYDVNYKHINDVNIILELIARYIIDQLNPDLRKIVSTNHNDYIRQSGIGI